MAVPYWYSPVRGEHLALFAGSQLHIKYDTVNRRYNLSIDGVGIHSTITNLPQAKRKLYCIAKVSKPKPPEELPRQATAEPAPQPEPAPLPPPPVIAAGPLPQPARRPVLTLAGPKWPRTEVTLTLRLSRDQKLSAGIAALEELVAILSDDFDIEAEFSLAEPAKVSA